MPKPGTFAPGSPSQRLAWVDTLRGLCIVLVVLMHEVAGFEVALREANWIDPFIEWARLFRMPAFLLASGLFAAGAVTRPWRDLIDRKVLPFVWLYLVWLAINCGLKVPVSAEGSLAALASAFAHGLVQPFGMLWFIYLLPIFFVVTRALRHRPLTLWLAAAALSLLPVTTGWVTIDQFAGRYVFFVTGALAAPAIRALAAWTGAHRPASGLLLAAWLATSAVLVLMFGAAGLARLPGGLLFAGLGGGAGLLMLAVLLAGKVPWLDRCGRESLAIYLAFFMPMALARELLIESDLSFDIGSTAILLSIISIAACLALKAAVSDTPLRFLFMAPASLRLPPRPAPISSPAAR